VTNEVVHIGEGRVEVLGSPPTRVEAKNPADHV